MNVLETRWCRDITLCFDWPRFRAVLFHRHNRGYRSPAGRWAGTRHSCGARAVAVDTGGNVYISDRDDARIRRVDGSGIITTFAGTGEGFSREIMGKLPRRHQRRGRSGHRRSQKRIPSRPGQQPCPQDRCKRHCHHRRRERPIVIHRRRRSRHLHIHGPAVGRRGHKRQSLYRRRGELSHTQSKRQRNHHHGRGHRTSGYGRRRACDGSPDRLLHQRCA